MFTTKNLHTQPLTQPTEAGKQVMDVKAALPPLDPEMEAILYRVSVECFIDYLLKD